MTLLSILALSVLVPQESPQELLAKVSSAIGSLKSVRYDYKRILDYPAEKFHHEMTGRSYLDFGSPFRFRHDTPSSFSIFNGSELFDGNTKDHTLSLIYGPPAEQLNATSFLKNSYLTLRNSLPLVMKGATVTVGPSQGETLTLILESPKQVLQNVGEPSKNQMDAKYEIVVRRADYLPLSVTQRYGTEGSFIRAEFANIETNPAAPDPKIWLYTTYTPEYTLTKDQDLKTIDVGKPAPDWELPVLGSKVSRSMKALRGKLVLLDFWITHCTPCVASVPKLNAIAEKYKNKDFALVAVNASDPEDQVNAFRKRTEAKYEMLWKGAKAAKSYGVSGFPTAVLVDKSGVVIYSGSFDEERIEKLIAANL